MPVATRGADGQPVTQQLIRSASLYLLANRLTEIGRDAAILWRSPDDWGDLGTVVDTWIEEAATGHRLRHRRRRFRWWTFRP